MSYIQELLTDEDVFPTKAGKLHSIHAALVFITIPGSMLSHYPCFPGSVFPTGFVFLVQKVFLLFFRTLAHIYWSHYRETLALGLHPHLNTLFTHLTLFCRQHALLEPEDIEPLQDLITALGQQDWAWRANTYFIPLNFHYTYLIMDYTAWLCISFKLASQYGFIFLCGKYCRWTVWGRMNVNGKAVQIRSSWPLL